MDLRSVQMTRGGTFFVSLPKGWANQNGLVRGSIVATSITADGHLIIDARYNVEPVPMTIVIKPSEHLDREIIGKYLLGYDIIQIEAKNRISFEDREKVERTASRLIGLEIIEENYSSIVMQCLLETSALPPERILKREQSIASGMYRDAITALIEGDTQLAKSVIARDNEVDRLYFLLVRILRRIIQNPSLSEKLKIPPIDCLDYRLTASLVESIGDLASQIAEHSLQLKGLKITKEIAKEISDFYEVVYDTYETSLRAFFSRDISMAESVGGKRVMVEELYRKVESLANMQPAELSQSILSVASIISQIYDHSVDISDLTMPRIH